MTSNRDEQWLRRSAIHYLGQRSTSAQNLRRVLTRRAKRKLEADEHSRIPDLVSSVVEFCIKNGFIDDDAYAGMKASQAERIGISKRKLGAKLAAKGIARDTIDSAVANLDDEASAILYAKRRRLGPWHPNQSGRDLNKDIAALVRAGFPVQVAVKTAKLSPADTSSME